MISTPVRWYLLWWGLVFVLFWVLVEWRGPGIIARGIALWKAGPR